MGWRGVGRDLAFKPVAYSERSCCLFSSNRHASRANKAAKNSVKFKIRIQIGSVHSFSRVANSCLQVVLTHTYTRYETSRLFYLKLVVLLLRSTLEASADLSARHAHKKKFKSDFLDARVSGARSYSSWHLTKAFFNCVIKHSHETIVGAVLVDF